MAYLKWKIFKIYNKQNTSNDVIFLTPDSPISQRSYFYRLTKKLNELKITQVNPYIDNEELELIKNVSDKWLTEGSQTNGAKSFSKLSGTKYVLPVPNGTVGLYLALLSLDLPKGSEVLVPSFTFFGSVSSIHFAGLIPRFVDVDENDYMANVRHYESAITSKTSAIMPIHIYGASADMDPIMEFAKKNNLKVVEDAAQAVGVRYKGEHSGNKGHVSVFSFLQQTVTMGEGGLLQLMMRRYLKIKLIRNQEDLIAGHLFILLLN